MPGNRTFSLLAVAYVLAIYASSGWMRSLSAFARRLAGEYLGPLMTVILALILAAVLTAVWRLLRPRSLLPYLPVVLGYGLALFWLTIPEERFHLLQYGILCFLCDRAVPGRLRVWRRHLVIVALVCLAGIGDELVQWLRPNRVGDLRDVVINGVAAVLAQSLIAVSTAARR